jgi:hypothetical protein
MVFGFKQRRSMGVAILTGLARLVEFEAARDFTRDTLDGVDDARQVCDRGLQGTSPYF